MEAEMETAADVETFEPAPDARLPEEATDDDAKQSPQQRALAVLARVNSAQRDIAKRELKMGKKQFTKLEAIYQLFRSAYQMVDVKGTRELFIDYLEQTPLQRKRRPLTPEQQAQAAKNAFLANATENSTLERNMLGVREALDPRTALTEDDETKLKALTLADGTNALQARHYAEFDYQNHGKLTFHIDVVAVYANPRPHLAAYRSAARDADYTDAEIDVATAGLTDQQLWSNAKDNLAMPATLAEFRKLFPKVQQLQAFVLRVVDLDDARTAIAQGMTLDQLDEARSRVGYDPNFQGKPTDEAVRTVIETYVSPELRPFYGPLLNKLVTGISGEREVAAWHLQTMIAGSLTPQGAKGLRQALGALQAHFGNTDPLISLLQAQLKLAEDPVAFDPQDAFRPPPDLLDQIVDPRTANQKKSDQQIADAKQQIAAVESAVAAGVKAGTLEPVEQANAYKMIAMLYRWYLGDPTREALYKEKELRIRLPDLDERLRDKQLTITSPKREPVSMSARPDEPGGAPEIGAVITTPDPRLRELYTEAAKVLGECRELRQWSDKKNGWHQTSQYYAPTIRLVIGDIEVTGMLGGLGGALEEALAREDADPTKERVVSDALSDAREALKRLRPRGQRAAAHLDEVREAGYTWLGRLRTAVKFVPVAGKYAAGVLMALEGTFRVLSGDWTIEEALSKTVFEIIDARFKSSWTGGSMVASTIKSGAFTAIKSSLGEVIAAISAPGLSPEQRGNRIAAAVAKALIEGFIDALAEVTKGAIKIRAEDRAEVLNAFVAAAKYLGVDQAVYGELDKLKKAWKQA